MEHTLLSDYVAALIRGQDPARAVPEAAAHVAACPQCQADVPALTTMAAHALHGGSQPVSAPAPDLSFLPRPTQSAIILRLGYAMARAATPPTLAGATRGSLMLRYTQDRTTTAGVEVAVEVYAEDADRTSGRVRVSVDLPGREPLDMAGSCVVLRLGEQSWNAETDEIGSADFAPVPLTRLSEMLVEVTPQG